MTVKEHLQQARKLLKTGWVQNTAFRIKNIKGAKVACYCATGALNHVVEDYYANQKACQVLVDANKIPVKKGYQEYPDTTMVHWNDKRGRTQDDVLTAFTKAIRLAGRREKQGVSTAK